ncbi:DUF6531 domain-containing protein [Gorillibacterium sp. sgz5001074]|uniref:DUF6531 domain-containing protein n=1 Tax=Gorillibacterium sp. sgz5001074 TaxID=3446695 RepID=UPI003F677C6B
MIRKTIVSGLMGISLLLQTALPVSFAGSNLPLADVSRGDLTPLASPIGSNGMGVTANVYQPATPDVNTLEYDQWKMGYTKSAPQARALRSMTAVSDNRMSNESIEYAVASNGRFTMGTTGGNPANPNDNGMNMLYGHPSPSTSYTTIRLDGTNVVFSGTPRFDQNGMTSTAELQNGDVSIKQVLSLVKNGATDREDTVQIKYILTNKGSASHSAGVRVMLDTMLGGNDAAPFRIPGIGAVTNELELTGDHVPEYWQAFDSLTNPSVISQGTLTGSSVNKPDKIQFTNWRRVYDTAWGYTVNPGLSNGDSAVNVIWEPETLQAGETQEYVTYYGLSEFTQDLKPPLAVSLTGASSVATAENSYMPNPFTVTAYIMNNGAATANQVRAGIILPDGLSLAQGQEQIDLGSLSPSGQERQVSWKVYINQPSDQERTFIYSVAVRADNADTKTVSRVLTVPALAVTDTLRYRAGLEDFKNGTSVAVEDPVNAATGNFVYDHEDIAVQGYQPLSFQRFYNSIDRWQGVLGTNWHHNYEITLLKAADKKVTVTFEDGHAELFTPQADGTYAPMPGKYGKLQELREGGYRLTLTNQSKYEFSQEGKLTAIENMKGHRTVITYDSGRISRVQTDSGLLAFTYSNGLLSRITDGAGRFVEYKYADGMLMSYSDVEGHTLSYGYDSKSRLTHILDPLNVTKIINVYDDEDRTTFQTMADGTTNAFSYDDAQLQSTLTQRNGIQIIYKRDQQYRIYERVYVNGTEKLTFNDHNQVTSFTDKKGHTYHYEYDGNGNITKETNPLGEVTQYQYDGHNQVVSIQYPDNSTYTYGYDAMGNLTTAMDALGRPVKMEYNEKGLPVKATNPDGSAASIQYDDKGNLIASVDPLGNKTTYEYDSLNRVIAVTKPEGNRIRYEYTPKGKVMKVTNPDGSTRSALYDERGLLIEETNENGAAITYKYNSMNKLVEKQDALNGSIKYEYDSMWNISKVTQADGGAVLYEYNDANQLVKVTDPMGHAVTYVHDANGNLTKQTDPYGNSTEYRYDALNRLMQAVAANKASTTYEYRYDGKIQKVMDALNGTTAYTYDKAGQLTSVTDAVYGTTSYSYDLRGRVAAVTNAKGAVTRLDYNANGNVTMITHADGTTERFAYDKNGNMIQAVDGKGNTTSYTYDNRDRVVAVKNALGGVKKVDYTKTGQVASVTDENGSKTIYHYDVLGRLSQVTDALGGKTTYGYDAVGNLTEVHRFVGVTQETIDEMKLPKNATGYQSGLSEQVTRYTYDRRGLLVEKRSPTNKVTVYRYDAVGNLLSRTDEDQLTTAYVYDPVYNLKKITYQDGKQVEFSYNALNQVIGMQDSLGKTEYELDALGRVRKVKDYENKLTAYTWGITGEQQSIQYPDGSVVTYGYDAKGRLTSVTDAQKKTTAYTYDAVGNLVQQIMPNGHKTVYQYDALSRLVTLKNSDPKGKTTDEFKYTYDAVGNKTKVDRQEMRDSILDWFDEDQGTTQYKYDPLNQLTEITKPNKSQEKFFYDTAGNRLRQENRVLGMLIGSQNYRYDADNQLVELTAKIPGLFGKENTLQTTQMEYDSRGNLTKTKMNGKVVSQYSFDAANRLVQADNMLGLKTNYTYDGAGRRVKMTVELPKPGFKLPDTKVNVLTLGIREDKDCNEQEVLGWFNRGKELKIEYNYVLDVTKPYQNVLMVYGKGIDTQRYTYGVDVVSVDSWHSSTDKWRQADMASIVAKKSEKAYYLQDDLGSPIRLTGEDGSSKATYHYDTFGRPILPKSIISNVVNPNNVYSYTGYQYDWSTGLQYAQARYYLPGVGRFISKDTYEGEITNPQSLNLWTYVHNNPMKYTDPTGHKVWLIHGTFSSGDTWTPEFVTYVEDLFNETSGKLNWSGKNKDEARSEAAEEALNEVYEWHKNNPDDPIRIVGHSHGGNVAILLTNLLAEKGMKVDTLITVATPVREYKLDTEVGQHIQMYNNRDIVQMDMGGYDFGWKIFNAGFGSTTSRKFKGADNVRAKDNETGTKVEAHSNMHSNVNTWKKYIEPILILQSKCYLSN